MTPRLRSGRRSPAPLALLLVCSVLATGAIATTLAADNRDGSATTPVEKYRAQALERLMTGGVSAARAADEQPDLENFEHVFHYAFEGNDEEGRRFSAHDQGTDIEFFTPTVQVRDDAGKPVLGADGQPLTEERDYAVVGSYDRGAFVFDITEPEKTRYVTQIVCRQKQNDIQIKQFGERWVVMLANDESGALCAGPKNVGPTTLRGGAAVFDVTDPREPEPMYNLRVRGGVHNWTWHPTAPVGWVSTGDLPGVVNHIPVYDFTDVDNPVMTADPATEGGPHDITFSTDGKFGYVASENNVRTYDATDPAKPVLLSRGLTLASYVHGTDPTPDGKTLLVTDESLVLGGFFASQTAVCPGGGITLFDTSTTPMRPLSYLLADIRGQSPDHRACTAHVGRFTPDSKHYVTGWYIGGVRVFDISNPSAPTEVGHAMMPGTEVWSAKFHKGQYVYTGDLGRGFDVYRWTGPELGTTPLG
ncbi:MAG TPA: hypothetical protein VM433_09715 [Mycobacteriales bacterium]|nr:hypothetical protein [Mycobacteriales bacterium]